MRMNRHVPTIAFTLALAAVVLAAPRDRDSPGNRGYSLGFDHGTQAIERLDAEGADVDVAQLIAGFTDAVRRTRPRISDAERRAILGSMSGEAAEREAEERMRYDAEFRAEAERNLERSRAHHATLRKTAGVRTLKSGLQYEVVRAGEGRSPRVSDTVVVSYEATTLDGDVVATGADQATKVNGVIRGAGEALRLMSRGARWRMSIPPDLAFGVAGRPPAVGPNETIVVDVTLHLIR
jgi:FKBP-type peptidyl-prolyl cis-trans isomerase FklB